MPYRLIDPGATLDFPCDWSDYLNDGSPSDSIVTSLWSITPQSGSPALPALSGQSFAGALTTVFVSGVQRGQVYRLTNRITTAQGRTDERSVILRCEQR